MDERGAMDRALALAWGGWGRVAPNPMVAAVVLAGNEVVGEGFHAEYGGPHAEPVALQAAAGRARGATLVTTLEPCAHWGKQPPCTEAIVRAGIARVVSAAADPHPAAQGGAAFLRRAGIQVEVGLGEAEARAQNAAFFHQVADTTRPFVTLKLAISLDGRIADHAARSQWVSGEEARTWVQWVRAGYDAIAVGGRTALLDDPALTVRGAITPRVAPTRIVFDGGLRLATASRLATTAREVPVLLVAVPTADAAKAATLEALGVRVLRAEGLRAALGSLRREHGIGSMLVEGGGRLGAAMLAEGVVDRVALVVAPLFLGEQGIPAFPGLPAVGIDASPRWRLVERRPLGADTLLVFDAPGG